MREDSVLLAFFQRFLISCSLQVAPGAVTVCARRDTGFVFFSVSLQQQEQDPTNLYISNLPLSMDEQELENMLKHFGQVISTRILRDSSGSSRGVGFARSAPFLARRLFPLNSRGPQGRCCMWNWAPRRSEPFKIQQGGFFFLLLAQNSTKTPLKLLEHKEFLHRTL